MLNTEGLRLHVADHDQPSTYIQSCYLEKQRS